LDQEYDSTRPGRDERFVDERGRDVVWDVARHQQSGTGGSERVPIELERVACVQLELGKPFAEAGSELAILLDGYDAIGSVQEGPRQPAYARSDLEDDIVPS
jgi:hypothetical protein